MFSTKELTTEQISQLSTGLFKLGAKPVEVENQTKPADLSNLNIPKDHALVITLEDENLTLKTEPYDWRKSSTTPL